MGLNYLMDMVDKWGTVDKFMAMIYNKAAWVVRVPTHLQLLPREQY